MAYVLNQEDIKQLKTRREEIKNSLGKLETAIARLNSEPTLENARLAHEASLRGAYAIYEIVEEQGGIPTETVYNYRAMNLKCLEALERVPVNNGDREHTRYWASLIIRRNEIVSKVKQFFKTENR